MQMLLRMAPHQVSDTSACCINCNRRQWDIIQSLGVYKLKRKKMGKSCRTLRLRVLVMHFPCIITLPNFYGEFDYLVQKWLYLLNICYL